MIVNCEYLVDTTVHVQSVFAVFWHSNTPTRGLCIADVLQLGPTHSDISVKTYFLSGRQLMCLELGKELVVELGKLLAR